MTPLPEGRRTSSRSFTRSTPKSRCSGLPSASATSSRPSLTSCTARSPALRTIARAGIPSPRTRTRRRPAPSWRHLRGGGSTALHAHAGDGGDVTKVGTPVNGQIGVWTGDGTIEGDAGLTFDGTDLSTTGIVNAATLRPTGDAAAGLAAALGYSAAEGAILTGQGSINDVTFKNDADAEVVGILTGTTTVKLAGIIQVDTISEKTGAAGVTIDGLLINDSAASGAWQGSVIDHERGGIELDISAVTTGDVLAGASAGVMSIVAASGASDGDVLTIQADGTAAWEAAAGGGGGAPTDADYLVGTAHGDLSAEIVVGTTPGGQLGGSWASPTVDSSHSGSSHHNSSHTVASHSDTSGTGAELNELTDGSETTLHSHAGGAGAITMTELLTPRHAQDSIWNIVVDWFVARATSTEKMGFVWHAPDNFASITSMELVMIPDTTETVTADFHMSISAVGENHNDDSEDQNNKTKAVTVNDLTEWDVGALMTGLGDIVAGDYVGLDVQSDTGSIRVVGLKIVWVTT